MSSILEQSKGGHNYGNEYSSAARVCEFECGACIGGSPWVAPDGIDPIGMCPNNPINNQKVGDVKILTARNLIGKKLDGFTIEEYTEVYENDEEGRRKVRTIGYFKDNTVAIAFSKKQTDSDYHQTLRVLLLTDSKVGFLVENVPVVLLSDEKATLEIREWALAQISPEVRVILGL